MSVLITGASGQIGSELVPFLKQKHGPGEIVTTYMFDETPPSDNDGSISVQLDARERDQLHQVVKQYNVSSIYHLVGILSARGEQDPELAWQTNMNSLKHILEIAVENNVTRIFWPSSIAVFGHTAPKELTPQHTILEPSTMYGTTKVAGELLAQYFFKRYGCDIRSLRLPGIISYKTEPGGGTTDYAVAMFYAAVQQEPYSCFVGADTVLPMMYMDDAIMAIDKLMSAPAENLTIRTSYNLTSLRFSAAELASAITKKIPGFRCEYKPDYRQNIADSWPRTIDDSVARKDWNWAPTYDLERMIHEMISGLNRKFSQKT